MAEYILDVTSQTSKLDWAFPFQRTGAFPIDRSTVFSSLADAEKYAKGDGSDDRALGGTSYVGQIISVYEAAIEADEIAGIEASPASVNAYIITPTRSILKIASNIDDVDIDLSNYYTKAEVDEKLNTPSVTDRVLTISTLKTAEVSEGILYI